MMFEDEDDEFEKHEVLEEIKDAIDKKGQEVTICDYEEGFAKLTAYADFHRFRTNQTEIDALFKVFKK